MQAATISGIGTIEIGEVEDPTPGPRDVVVEVVGSGVCGTDLHIMQGEFAPSLPIIPGHEFSGTVVAIGNQVDEVAVGDRVAADPSLYCNECYQCRRGHNNMCERWAAIGVTHPGAAAQYTVAPAANCWKVPEHVELADAALVEPISCGVRGMDVLRPNLGDSFLIYGAGTMGLIMLELAKRAGAASVSVVDINPDRLETARALGCTDAVGSADELDYPRLWDNVIDCTGSAAAIQDGLNRVGKGGTYQQFGVAAYATRATIEPYKIYNQEIRIIGSMSVLRSYERAGKLLAAGVIDPKVMITDRLPLSQYVEAIEKVRAGVGRKIQINPNQ